MWLIIDKRADPEVAARTGTLALRGLGLGAELEKRDGHQGARFNCYPIAAANPAFQHEITGVMQK